MEGQGIQWNLPCRRQFLGRMSPKEFGYLECLLQRSRPGRLGVQSRQNWRLPRPPQVLEDVRLSPDLQYCSVFTLSNARAKVDNAIDMWVRRLRKALDKGRTVGVGISNAAQASQAQY